MVLYNGNNIYKSKPLFRAAIMDSGSITPVNPIDSPKAQAIYDQVVSQAGCSSSDDTLNCLRGVDYTKFLTAVTSVPPIFSFSSIALSYLPRPDGVLLAASPEVLLLAGNITGIPFIIGDQEDEGTLFSLEQTNISTTADIENYLSTLFFPNASATQIQQLVATYPDNPSAGSPFNQGAVGNIYLQFKRLAALLGDSFTLRRRGFLAGYSQLEPNISTYLYLNSYSSDMPILGTFHASDILQVFGELQDGASASVQDYYLSFINDLDPNTGKAGKQLSWPEWGEGNMLMQWKDFGVLDLGRGLLSDT
jgi:carboxylesterase type B